MKQIELGIFRKILSLLVGLLLSVGAFAQITVNGLVKDDLGEPIPGARVQVKTGSTVSVTDIDGNFRINCAKGATLVVSCMSFQTKEATASPNMVVVLTEDSKLMDEVVVIGYGHAKKDDLTGSVTAMKPDDMSKGITNSATDMLVGKIAGVDVITGGGTPGAGAQIRIRGGSSLNASNDPLYVIDGLVIDNATAKGMSNILANINPNDIETFTVLKDASATAIYGSRASNGVIIITTKKGKNGTPAKLSYNGDLTVSTVQKKYEMLSGDEYRNLVANTPGLDPTKLGTANTDWQDEIFRTSVSTNHNISIAGGLKNMPYRVSAGYNMNNGILTNSNMRRTNASVNLAPTFLDKHLNFNITAKYLHEEDRYVDAGGVIGTALAIDPTRPVYDGSANGRYFAGYYQPAINASFSDPSWALTNNPNAPQNPVALLHNQYIYAAANDFTGNISAEYKIHRFEDLSIHGNFGAQYTASNQDDVISPYSYSNNYYGWDGVTKYKKYSMSGNAYLQYAHVWNQKHDFNIMAGGEETHYHRSGWNAGQGTDPYTGAAYNVTLRSQQAWAAHNTLLSYFGRANYTLLDRYMFTATMRADGSSKFTKDNRWGYFPSAAVAWKINNEKFLKEATWLDDLKLRLGWGQTGQQDGIGEFDYTPVYTNSNNNALYPFGGQYYPTQRPSAYNEDLTWETTTTYNAGLDFSAMNGRFTFNIDGYYRETDDLLNTVIIPVGTNFGSTLTKNIGSLKNYGVEFAFDVKPVVTKNFTWDLSYNVSWNHNEITSLKGNGGDNERYYVMTGETISRGNSTNIMANTVGQPVNSFFVYQQVYDEFGKPIEGMYVDRNADGQINEDDRYFYKKPSADVIMGLTTKFIYKNWDLSLAFHASLGNYVYYNHLSDHAPISASGLYSNSAFHNTSPEAVALGFTGLGTEYYLSDYFVRNASYLKCSNITLGYSFPGFVKAGDRKIMDGRVYLTAQNPFFVTKYKGLDPEVSSGVDKNPYPRPMSFQLGVNFNF